MEVSKEPRTLAVACHDLGQFMQHHSSGKRIVQVRRSSPHACHVRLFCAIPSCGDTAHIIVTCGTYRAHLPGTCHLQQKGECDQVMGASGK
jgi:hypothetical protein